LVDFRVWPDVVTVFVRPVLTFQYFHLKSLGLIASTKYGSGVDLWRCTR